jgi:hypothetical protein
VDRHRSDGDPVTAFHFDANDADQIRILPRVLLFISAMPVYMSHVNSLRYGNKPSILCRHFALQLLNQPINCGTWNQKPFTEDPASEGSNILVWFGSLCVLPSPWMYCEAHLGTVGVPFYENWRGRGVFTRNGKTSLVHYRTLSFLAFSFFFLNENSLFFAFSSSKSLSNLFASLR